MSARVANLVQKAEFDSPSLKLLTYDLALRGDDQGGSIYPSVKTIALSIGLSESQTQRLLRKLEGHGVLSVVKNKFGGKPGATRHYQLHLHRLAELSATGRTRAGDGSHPRSETGRMDATQLIVDSLSETEIALGNESADARGAWDSVVTTLVSSGMDESSAVTFLTEWRTRLSERFDEALRAFLKSQPNHPRAYLKGIFKKKLNGKPAVTSSATQVRTIAQAAAPASGNSRMQLATVEGTASEVTPCPPEYMVRIDALRSRLSGAGHRN